MAKGRCFQGPPASRIAYGQTDGLSTADVITGRASACGNRLFVGPHDTLFLAREGSTPDIPSAPANLDDVPDLNVTPLACQVLRDKATMTVRGLIFAAKQTSAFQKFTRHFSLDLPRGHQV